jgi:hypothetical protein
MKPLSPRSAAQERFWVRSRIAYGLSLVCLMFVLETAVAHRSAPQPASAWIWGGLGLGALAGLLLGWLWGRRAKAP